MMREVVLSQPSVVRFGRGCRHSLADYFHQRALKSAILYCSPSLEEAALQLAETLRIANLRIDISILPTGEPSVTQFESALSAARAIDADCVLAVGGGSVLDVAKLVAALAKSTQQVSDCFGIGLIRARETALICLPSTAGTGSEVSPNAILLDERDNLKKGVISPFLVPDATFIDPELAVSVPPKVTAFTGLDTLTHCIEAYTNRFAHPLVDIYALEGIRLTAKYLVRAVRNGEDLEAREGMAAASYYGGLCLGPVNTAAVHALAYPLGSRYHIAHGLSNAVLLAAVSRANLPSAIDRYAAVALALGADQGESAVETAERGIVAMEELLRACDIQADLASLGVNRSDVPELALAASTVTRLLKNNPLPLTVVDIETIYKACFLS